ncbi:hypothetical protein V500_07905 [Pseudogymnoascus sp. VKM F-4518 (FW-2643)]|nr:hypothetical protein V500_07905 [Pseudogymnoascus sp. VKM F-4518 (FW-2643)]
MTKEELNSDRINYLVWRYLQESNYRETAVKLQSEWDVSDPQSLDFAPHVNNHALVAVLQRGLLYHEAERLSAQSRRGAVAVAPATGFFGPVAPLSPPLASSDEIANANARKRSTEERSQQARQESPAKRTKLSNGYENGIDSTTTPMDLDEAAPPPAAISNGHAYPSPREVEVERVPTPAPVTSGPEKGTQIEKVAELSAETTYLTLAQTSTTNHPILLHCEWNPRDPKRLATAGMDTLARLWTVPSRTPSPQIDGHVPSPAFRDLVDEDEHRAAISAISWTSDGEALAVASDCDGTGKINIWSKDGSRIVQFNSLGYPPVICLRWGASDRTLLALTSTDNKGASSWATVFTTPNQESATFDLGPNFQPLDAVWTGASDFVVCNGESLTGFNLSEEGIITRTKQYDIRKEAGPTSLAYDPHCNLLAAANDDGVIDIWDSAATRVGMATHNGAITSMKWQPIPSSSDGQPERLLASSSEDGTINIWNSRSDFKKPVETMTMDAAVLALAFTPDGAFVAATTNSHILIWNMADPSFPRARWVRGQEPGWQSPKMNGAALEEYHHCLCWDSDGKRLAYGVNSMLAVIKFIPGVTDVSVN